MQLKVLGEGTCTEAMIRCDSKQECHKYCKSKFTHGVGSCESDLCTCTYECGPVPPDEPPRRCSIGRGSCDACKGCCYKICTNEYKNGLAYCNVLTPTSRICMCTYDCWISCLK